MIEYLQTTDVIIDKLTETSGEELEITANITHPAQIAAIMQGYVAKTLHSGYGVAKYQMLLRLTNSYQGRCRDDLRAIGETPEIQGWQPGGGKD